MNTQLTVYKASAGSGKTFTLAKEYMTLVIDNPMAYRTILAVTFTNKATEEMKLRILSQLYGISRQLPESQEYLRQIHDSLPHLSEKQIVKHAGEALSLLIHNYNYFHVETIDTFFQSVLRNLARELDLTANLRIELNDYQVEAQAVDELIESLQSTNKLLFWILDYIRENIADNKSWNVIGQIKRFGENIFKDYYKENARALNEKLNTEGFFQEYTSKLRQAQKQAKDFMKEIAETFFDALEANDLTVDDFALKQKGICSYFLKLKKGDFIDEKKIETKTLEKCKLDPKNWVKAADAKKGCPALDLVYSTLFDLLNFSENNRMKMVSLYKSATLTLKHVNQLRLLNSIEQKVRELNENANRFLLSDTQTLLHSLMKDSDSPFIFEKMGTQLEHVMIDEFQDTSTIQWKNFRILLDETMSHEHGGNLIVGDVKQSIYRWRSGDWRLLNNIEREFDGHEKLEIKSLATNYRSEANIVSFNNVFFSAAAAVEADAIAAENMNSEHDAGDEGQQLLTAYADVAQQLPAKRQNNREGLVHIELMGKETTSEEMMQRTLETINLLTEKGVRENQIAILVRSNRTIQDIAEYLSHNSDHKLISDEAFRLDASQAVNYIITTLRFLDNPDDTISEAILRKFAVQYRHSDNLVELLREKRVEYLQTPFYEMVEKINTLLKFDEIEDLSQQGAYICAFFDQLVSYLEDHVADMKEFLAEWDAHLSSKSIQSDNTDGIRLLTIHKSKGLEFDNVIMPFCDWALEKPNSVIWCSPTHQPFNELPLVPVDFSAKMMKQSIYEDDYRLEHLQNMVDNLNLLYVAFTRAGKNLFVLGSVGGSNCRSHTIEMVLPKVKENLEKAGETCTLNMEENEGKTVAMSFEYGVLSLSEEKKKEKKSDNVFTQPEQPLQIDITSNDMLPEFKESNKSRDFIQGDDEEEQHRHYVKMGTVLHQLFSTIQTQDDIEKALRTFEQEGVIYDDNVSRERLERLLRKRFETPVVADWFSARWKVFNECSIILIKDGKLQEYRPDRVMMDEDGNVTVVDFKFGKPHKEHHEQVKGYMQLLNDMGYVCVKGYLWYVYPNDIEEVK